MSALVGNNSDSTQSDGDKVLNDLLREVCNDTPKIDVSMKNFISLHIAQESNITAISNSLGNTHSQEPLAPLTSNQVMGIARLILKTIQEVELLATEEYFGCEKPQDNQSASDRLTDICRYKVIYTLRRSVILQNGKVSKTFGRRYFQWTNCWQKVKARIYEQLQQNNNSLMIGLGGEENVNKLINSYEGALMDSSDSDVIWAVNFNEALAQRQQQRKKVAEERLQQLARDIINDNGDEEGNEYTNANGDDTLTENQVGN